jgi:copper resistance protein B
MRKHLAAATLIALLGLGQTALAHDGMGSTGEATEAAPFGSPVDDQRIYFHVLADQLEGRFGTGSGFRWETEGWAGTDYDRVYLKSEGFATGGKIEDGRHELLYAKPISSFFDLQGGVRIDADSRAGRTWAAFGIEGLAPLFFHVSATGYVSDRGHVAARLEGSYDLLLTQRLILQPQAELNLYSKSDPGRAIGAGISDLDMGLRLRYEFDRKFAPYIGVAYENKFAGTANYARAAGEPTSGLRFLAGVRVWF